jgi:cytosine/adenosine deaminase-related metal-dependent hydrolase
MENQAILIKGGLLMSLDEKSGSLGSVREADLLVRGSKISAIGPDLSATGADTIPANDCLVMPGFVDTHRHVWQTALRGICGEWSLKEYMTGIRFQRAKLYRPEDVYAANYVGMLEALNAGVTKVFDFSHCINTPEHASAAIDGLRASGGRAVFGYGFNHVPLEQPYFTSTEQRGAVARQLRKETLSSDDALVTMGLSLSDMLVSGADRAKAELSIGRDLG